MTKIVVDASVAEAGTAEALVLLKGILGLNKSGTEN